MHVVFFSTKVPTPRLRMRKSRQLTFIRGSNFYTLTYRRGATLFNYANIGFSKAGMDGDRPAIINMLQHSDGDLLEDTSENWEVYLFIALSRPWTDPESLRSGRRSTYLQRLKQLGIRFSKEPHSKSPIFLWLEYISREEESIKPGHLDFMLQTMLDFGADCNIRYSALCVLHYVFIGSLFSDETRLNVQRHNLMETAKALLNQGADLFALTDHGLSVLDITEHFGWTNELYEALQQTGYDLDEVRRKIDLAQWFFFNPDEAFAVSTAIDSSLNKPPTRAGLSLRRGMPGDRLED